MDGVTGSRISAPSNDVASDQNGGHSIPYLNRKAIADYIAAGATCVGCGKIGIELEHQIVTREGHRAVSYSQDHGIRDILQALMPAYDQTTYEEGNLIGLARADSTITIEPAGQLEISIAPMDSLHCVKSIYDEWRVRLDAILQPWGLIAMNVGYHPTASAPELELIPKERYRLMNAWFKTTGTHGIDMMRGSASTQISIDYTGENDAIRKFKLANILGPLFAFMTDNTPKFRGKRAQGRMVRTRIWDDVDPERSMVVPGLLGDGTEDHHGSGVGHRYTFLDYADHLMSSHPILIMEDGSAKSADHLTADEIYADHVMSVEEVQHLISMFFPDVRLKSYVEIRMADSLPIDHALAYAALVAGIFYEHRNMTAIEGLLDEYCPHISDSAIPAAKNALMEDGWMASVYGRPAYEWVDDLLAMAWGGLPADERAYLDPLVDLAEKRTTLFDLALDREDASARQDEQDTAQREAANTAEQEEPAAASTFLDMTVAEKDFARHVEELPGNDVEGCRIASDAMHASTAIYHGNVIDYLRIPAILPQASRDALARTAQMTHRILCKIIDRYMEDEGYRRLFGFPEELERLVMLDRGYEQAIPIARFDIFLDREAPLDEDGFPRFSFCEFNTDGTSAMNEDHELARALSLTPSFHEACATRQLVPQTLFDPWVRALWRIWRDWQAHHPGTPDIPRVAIVDYMEHATAYEFEAFRKRFELAGIPCTTCDVRDLMIKRGRLYGCDGHPVDCIYRRATTSDVMEHLADSPALIDAARNGRAAIIGDFVTDVAHCKKVSQVLGLPQTEAFLTPVERRFVARHVPFTESLTRSHETGGCDLAQIRADKDRWIIKPDDGYASSGVFAGLDVTQEEWNHLIDHCSDSGYIVQAYAAQYSRDNIPGLLRDGQEPSDLGGFEPYNEMMGLYVYDGRFAGIYTRAGRDAVIGGTHEQPTVCGFLCGNRH